MSQLPYNVAGGLAGAIRLAVGGLAGAADVPPPLVELELVRASGSRRRRLWEFQHKFHCPVIGVCFACDELRGLMAKVMHFPAETTDFVLHTTAVGACEQRSRLAELLHKTLETRYRLTVQSLSAIRTNIDLRAAWLQACADGTNIPGTLWACWTHPAIDSVLEQEIFADIHMLQHQIGSGARADLKAMQRLREENRALRQQLEAASSDLDALRTEKSAAAQAAAREIAEVRAELVAAEARGERAERELADRYGNVTERKAQAELAHRLLHAEAQAAAGRQRADALEKEVLRLREFACHAEETIEVLSREEAGEVDEANKIARNAAALELPESHLCGKAVLCVGGRSGSVNSYREVVEQSGGRFLHHDGGLEENLHRIDNVVAAADIVICQAGCISHNAYWRVKEHCKRTGKPCMFVKNSGVSSFGRVVKEASGQDAL